MYTTGRVGAIAFLGIGFLLITFVPAAIRSWATTDLIVVLAIAGVVLLSTGRLWFERVRDTEGDYDERQTAIRYRSGWVTSWVLIPTVWAIWSIEFFTDTRLPPGAFSVIGLGCVFASDRELRPAQTTDVTRGRTDGEHTESLAGEAGPHPEGPGD